MGGIYILMRVVMVVVDGLGEDGVGNEFEGRVVDDVHMW